MSVINRASLAKALMKFRTYRFDRGRENSHLLLDALEYKGKRQSWQIEALLIKFVEDYCEDNSSNPDILLVAFGLLNSYEKIRFLSDRRFKYLKESTIIKDFYPADYEKYIKSTDDEKNEILKSVDLRLRKTEEELLDNLADFIVEEIVKKGKLNSYIEDIDDFVVEVQDPSRPSKKYRAKLPFPSYPIITDAPVVAIQHSDSELHILTPNVPIWEDSRIIGRDDFVDGLCQELLVGTPHLQLSGMGGIGKTEILRKIYINFANNELQHYFSRVGLLNYDGNIDLNMAQQIDCPGDGSAKSVWNYLRVECEKSRVLLLVDDIRPHQAVDAEAEIPEDNLEKLLTLRLTVLLASRTLHDKFENKPVEALPMDPCMQIFLDQRFVGKRDPSSLTDEEMQIIKDIIKNRAGYNTLIVNRLGAMAREHSWNMTMLSDRLKRLGFSMKKKYPSEEKFQDEINKLYNLKNISRPAEMNLLEAFALLPTIPLKQNTCVTWLRDDARIDEDTCRLALGMLSKQTWLTFHEGEEFESNSFVMHQLVKSAVVAQAKISIDNHINLVKYCCEAIAFDIIDSFVNVQPYIQFAVSLSNFFISEKRTELADLMNNIGRYLEETASFDQALKWHEKAQSIREQVLGPDHPDTATSYHNIGRVYDNKGDYPLAREWYHKALAIREKVLGYEHPDTADTYHRIGFAHQKSNYPEALNWYRKALVIRLKVFGPEHLKTAESYQGIAGVHMRLGKSDPSIKLYLKALQIRKDNLNSEHPLIATTQSCIAQVFIRQNNGAESLKWDNAALEIREKVLGKTHPDTAATYNHIAKAYTMLGKFDLALAKHHEALEVREKTIGTEHAFTATTYNDIGEVHFLQENYDEALIWYEKALSVRTKTLGTESAAIATSYFNIAKVFEKQGKYSAAVGKYKLALEIRVKALGEEHPSTTAARRVVERLTKNFQK